MNDPGSPPETADLDAFLGAYALDALDADDRARVEAYLTSNDGARAEVDEMRETAASLALLPDSPMDAPPELWARITQTIATESTTVGTTIPEPVDELATRRATAARSRWIAPVAAAAAIVVVFLAVQVVSLHGRLGTANSVGTKGVAAAFDRATKAQGARQVGLESETGATLARVVLLPDGQGYLRGDHLARLSPTKTYQLWALTGNVSTPTIVSAGVLGSDPSAVSFHANGAIHGFAVTVENSGGVVRSHHTAIASAELS